MSTRSSLNALSGAWLTALYLLGGIAAGLALALPVSEIPTPGHAHVVRNTLSGVVLFTVVLLASRAWGRALGARLGADARRMGRVAALSFAPTMMLVGVVLGVLEPVFAAQGAERGLPIHVVFGILFVPSAALVAGVTTFALERSVGTLRTALKLAIVAAGAAGGVFLVVDVLMDTIGWRVGAPGAAERATMLVVTLLGCLAAALAGGAVLGRGIGRR